MIAPLLLLRIELKKYTDKRIETNIVKIISPDNEGNSLIDGAMTAILNVV